ncbi:MAG: c-type cytochrome [Pseudomonas sp.]
MTLTYWPLAGLCGLLLATQAQAVEGQDIYTQGGAAPAVTACSSCHGADGMGMAAAGFPRLAGLSAEYLTKQIKDFRSGTRANSVMQPIAAALSDDEVTAVTQMLAGMPAPEVERFSRSAEAEGLGAVLALRGAWERNIPACVACHGPSGVGVGSAFPPLAGQPSQYLTAQLNAWRQGTRQNDPNDLMGHIARSMTDAEIDAVSRYFASLSQ